MAFLALLIAVLYGDILFLGRGLYLQDIISYHVPMKWIVRQVVAHGELPLWNRFYSAGQPLAANPAYEVFYPPQWLIWLPSFHFGFQLHILLHFVIAAIGMVALLRGLGARSLAATFGAAVFVMSGPYLSLSMKLPLLFSLSWMPLALHCARRAIVERRRRDFATAAVVLAMQLLIGEPTMALQTWLIIGGYALWRRVDVRKSILTIAALGIAAALVAAVQLVPMIDFTRDSVRSEPFELRVVSNWSMPLVRPVEMLLPGLFRHVTNESGAPAITTMYPFRSDAFIGEMYIGLFVALLAISGVLAGSRGAGIFAATVALSVIAAAGEHTPLLRILYDMHLFRSLRYPEKFIMTVALAMIVWSALLLDRMLGGDRRLVRTASIVATIWLAIVVITVLAAGGTRAYFAVQLLRAVVVVALFVAARRKTIAPAWPIAVIALSIVDLWFATRARVPRMPREYFDAPPLARQLPRSGRIFPEAYWQAFENDPNALAWIMNRPDEVYWRMQRNGLADHLPARFGFELVLEDDVDRTALKNTDALREAMKTLRARHAVAAEEPFLKMSNVAVRLRFRPAETSATIDTTPVEAVPAGDYPRYAFADRVERVATIGDLVAKVDLQRGLSYVAFADIEPFAPARGEVIEQHESANTARIRVRATGRAFLVMSVTGHRWWSATLDGRPATLIATNVAYQGMVVPAGEHVIEMRYRNPWVWVGAVITLLALAAAARSLTSREEVD